MKKEDWKELSKQLKENKGKIKLSHKCVFCNEDIYLGTSTIYKGSPSHTECLLKNEREKIFEKIDELEFAEYNDVEKRINKIKEIKNE